MTDPNLPAVQPGEPYVLIDASGRRFVSLAPAVQQLATGTVQPHSVHQAAGHCCSCGHGAAPEVPRRPYGVSPGTVVTGVVVVGVVLVALLLSVAVTAVAVAVCAVVLRSLVANSRRERARRR
ncbi:hypothetical protein [Streptomyces sp. 7N604]|uniref:hypothetical protein n=1 Tax=Streptomyces sp. 7N604 TaxID=3457415 RepID=UPI003FD00843